MKKVLLSLALCFSFFTLFFPIDISVYAEEVLISSLEDLKQSMFLANLQILYIQRIRREK